MNNDYQKCTDFASLAASLKGFKRPDPKPKPPQTTVIESKNAVEPEDDTPIVPVEHTLQYSSIDQNITDLLPIMEQLSVDCPEGTFCSLDYDPVYSGGRLLAGTSTGVVSFYDYTRLTPSPSGPSPNRLVQLNSDGGPIPFLHFCPPSLSSGEANLILTCTRSSPAVLLDADSGKLRHECAKGDRYVMDQRQVKGHTGNLTCALWSGPDLFMTGSEDGTVREWLVGQREQRGVVCLLERRHDASGFSQRPTVGSVACVGESVVLVGVDDGVVRVMDRRKVDISRPTMTMDTRHGELITKIMVENEHQILTRTESFILEFDLRKPTEYQNISQRIPGSCLLPYDGLLLTARNSKKDSQLVVLRRQDLLPVHHIDLSSPIMDIAFSPQLNQISIATTKNIVSFYDPKRSRKGALLYRPLTTTNSKRDAFIAPTTTSSATIFTPNSLPMFALPSSELDLLSDPLPLRRLRDRLSPSRSSRPDIPVPAEGHSGRIGSGPNAALMRQVMEERARRSGKREYFERDEDPREALLRYAEVAEREPFFVAPAYKDTQPIKKVFLEDQDDGETEKKDK